jgi:hypothetical protein
MTFEEALRTRLTAQPGIVSVVGDRIAPDVIAQDAQLPALVYELPAIDHDEHTEGSSGVAFATVRITAWAKTKIQARELAEAVRLAMVPTEHGDMWGTLRIGYVDAVADDAGIDLDTGDRYVSVDFNVGFYEPKEQ